MLWADRFDFEMLDGTQLNPNTYEIRNLPYAGPGYSVRGLRVILDSDLAAIYGVSTKRLNE